MQKLCVVSLLVFCIGLSCNAWTADHKENFVVTAIRKNHGKSGVALYEDLLKTISQKASYEYDSKVRQLVVYNAQDLNKQFPSLRKTTFKNEGWKFEKDYFNSGYNTSTGIYQIAFYFVGNSHAERLK